VPGDSWKNSGVESVDPGFRAGEVDFCGVRRMVNLAFTPDVVAGDFVLVHVGVALSKVDGEEARRTYRLLVEIGALETEP
jgi:hydrogenase expression/formation protein HypC